MPCLAIAVGDGSDRHGRLYRAGRQAHLAGNHRNAVLLLLDAVRARSIEGEPWVRLYGRHRAPYLPFFYLGASLYELGEFERARAAFDESARQGAVLRAEERGRLEEYRRRLDEEAAPALRERTALEAEQLRALLARLDRALADAGATTDPNTARGSAPAALASAAELAARAEPPDAASIPDLRQAAERLDHAAAEVSRAILAAETERAAREAERRSEALRDLLDRPGDGCDPARFDQLGRRLEEAPFHPETAARARLARARLALACDDPEAARRELGRAREAVAGSPASDPVVASMLAETTAIAREAGRRDLARRWQALRIHATGASCDPAAVDELESFALGLDDEALPFAPFLALARARLSCDDPARARASLERAEQRGEGSAAERAEVSRRIAAVVEAAERRAERDARERDEQRRRDDERARRALLVDFVELAAEAALGQCDEGRLERLDRFFSDPAEAERAAWVSRTAVLGEDPDEVLLAAMRSCDDVEGVRRRLESRTDRSETAAPPAIREARRWLVGRQVRALYSGRRALLVGASDYAPARAGWWNLDGVRSDVGQLAEFLRSTGFDTVEVLPPPVTGERVRAAVAGFVERHAGGDDLLLFYFAGHGETLSASLDAPAGGYEFRSGYFVPEDAPRPGDDSALRELFLERAVGMDEVERWARAIRAKHALFLFDTCFSGTVFRAVSRGRGLVLAREEERSPTRLPSLVVARAASPVRLFATAGTENQVVPDDSVFRRLLLEALSGRRRDADYTRDGFLLGREICLFLEDQVAHETASRQTPQCGTMPPPYNEGDVIFEVPPAADGPDRDPAGASERLRGEIDDWRRLRDLPGGPTGYLELHPTGRFAGLARYLALQGEDAAPRAGDQNGS